MGKKFRKKPVVIEAEQFHRAVEPWPEGVYRDRTMSDRECFIDTLEGALHVSEGDWIITGIQGERYPCKPEVFEATYEPVDKMSRIISFSYTTPALLAGAKTVTRREWKEATARKFHAGDYVQAFDRSPRQHGKRVAWIRLTADPTFEEPNSAPDSDYDAEGFAWLAEHPECLPTGERFVYLENISREAFDRWREYGWGPGSRLWVVRFELAGTGEWPI